MDSQLFRAEEKRCGSVFYCRSSSSSSSTTSGKLAFLNNIVGVFEYEADEIDTHKEKYENGNSKPLYYY